MAEPEPTVGIANLYYDDGLIQLDREALTLRRYHFPSPPIVLECL